MKITLTILLLVVSFFSSHAHATSTYPTGNASCAAGYSSCPASTGTVSYFASACPAVLPGTSQFVYNGTGTYTYVCNSNQYAPHVYWTVYSSAGSSTCSSGSTWNASTGMCDGPTTCPSGQILYNGTCQAASACAAGNATTYSYPVVDTKGNRCIASYGVSGGCTSGYPAAAAPQTGLDVNGCPSVYSGVATCQGNPGQQVVCTINAFQSGASAVAPTTVAAASAASATATQNQQNASDAATAAASAASAAGTAATQAASAVAAAGGSPAAQQAAANAAAQAVTAAATGQNANPIASFCADNPTAKICQTGTGTFAGTCGTAPNVSCTDTDPVNCAIAQATFEANCALQQQFVSDNTQANIGTAAIAGTDTGNTNNPALPANQTKQDMSSLVSLGTPVFSRAGLQDQTFNTSTNYAVTIPFSKLNAPLSTIGAIGVAATLVLALFIIFM